MMRASISVCMCLVVTKSAGSKSLDHSDWDERLMILEERRRGQRNRKEESDYPDVTYVDGVKIVRATVLKSMGAEELRRRWTPLKNEKGEPLTPEEYETVEEERALRGGGFCRSKSPTDATKKDCEKEKQEGYKAGYWEGHRDARLQLLFEQQRREKEL